MARMFDVDRDGYVFLPDRRNGLIGAFLYADVRIRDFTDERWPEHRYVEFAGVDAGGLPPEPGDAIVVRLDRTGVLALVGQLLDLADRIDAGEVRA